ncbi:MAG: hypothetical protein JXD18_14960 [Anaerolineae bacterium]|nr:hypothetical protein [Anaerolineae bacterium]
MSALHTIRWLTPLVRKHSRQGRRQPEATCYCEAAPWPHRAGSVEGCYGLAFCEHGLPTRDHPDYESRCAECERLEWGDFQYHRLRDDGRI